MVKRQSVQSSPKKPQSSIFWLKNLSQKDSIFVGENIALLAEVSHALAKKNIVIPDGFALSPDVYWNMLEVSGLRSTIKQLLRGLNTKDRKQIKKISHTIRTLILDQKFSSEVEHEIEGAYALLKKKKKGPIAVRSSAVCNNLPPGVTAGECDSVWNVKSKSQLFAAIKTCMASLFSVEALVSRDQQGIDHLSVGIAVLVQRMVDASSGTSGTITTLDVRSGFRGVSYVSARYGYHMPVHREASDSDRFCLFTDGVLRGKEAIIQRVKGQKEYTSILNPKTGITATRTARTDSNRFCLVAPQVVQLAKWGSAIESHVGEPVRISWVQERRTEKFFIVQIEPLRVQVPAHEASTETYTLKKTGNVLMRGTAIGHKIGAGVMRVVETSAEAKKFVQGEILVAPELRSEYAYLVPQASAIILESGTASGRAATLAREYGIPLIIVGEKVRRGVLQTGTPVTVDCTQDAEGVVYRGVLPFEVVRTVVQDIQHTKTRTMLNMSDPNTAFHTSSLPHDGGFAREEHLLRHHVEVHPRALVHYKKLKDKAAKKKIKALTGDYKDKVEYGIATLAEGIGTLATAVYPKPLVLKLSDMQTHEFASLIGGKEFEPTEHNASLGWRGASRFYSEEYKDAFAIHCRAIKRVREEWGLENVVVMVPFCRTPEEGEMVLKSMEECGLVRGLHGLKVHVMCEIPSNVILAEEFANIFDGFSIGSGDLTQLTLGIDKESTVLSDMYNEQHPAIKKLIADVIAIGHRHKKTVGMCGQAPSDSPMFTEFLLQCGIDSIALNPDVLIAQKQSIAMIERTIGRTGKRTNKTLLGLVSMIGLLGAGLVSLGAGCGGIVPASPVVEPSDMSPAQLRQRIEERVEDMKAREHASETKDLFVDDFADFHLSYPIAWNIQQWRGGVTLSDPATDAYVTIAEQLVPVPSSAGVPVVIDGVAGTQYDVVLPDGQHMYLVELLYNGKLLQLSGSIDTFQSIVQTLDFVSSTSPAIGDGRPLNEWDVKEKRLCAQVITYARERPDARCIAYPSPCEVPSGWTVCSTQ